MEFIEGETLEARVRRTGPLSIWLVLEVGIEAARALMAACHQDLIHRDLKPANLMLVASAEAATLAAVGTESSHGETSEAWVKVIDFGLAKAAAEAGPLTGAGDFVGTPAYASPEQFAGNARCVDGRSDIYSLGGTLWYALTGKMPFEGGSFTEIERQKRSLEVRPAQLTAAGIPCPPRTIADLHARRRSRRPAANPHGLAGSVPALPRGTAPAHTRRSRSAATRIVFLGASGVATSTGAFIRCASVTRSVRGWCCRLPRPCCQLWIGHTGSCGR